MKDALHPTYYPKAKVRCACGYLYIVGATRPQMTVEICSHCHPFYTGQEKLIDIAGRVEKFKSRQARAKTTGKTIKLKSISKLRAPKRASKRAKTPSKKQ